MRRVTRIGVFVWAACATTAHGQWQMQSSNTTADLRGIASIGNGVAWASGTNGTVLRTEDGGYVWQTCSIPPGAEKLDFRGIQAFRRKHSHRHVLRQRRSVPAVQDDRWMPFVEAGVYESR